MDSLKVRIPLSEVTITNQGVFGSKYIVDAESGDVESEYKQKRYKVSKEGITTSFGLESQVGADQKVNEYLVILFNSKLLQHKYFEGITLDNIEFVYTQIQGLGVAYFTYETFLKAEATDVDYKQDYFVTLFDKMTQYIYSHAKPSRKVGRGCNVFDKRHNKGIEFGNRDTASPANPYLKIYHKGLELLHSSKVFYAKYLNHSDVDVKNMARVEFTIKNKKHFKKHQVEDTTLGALLGISQSKLQEILKHTFDAHVAKRITIKKVKEDMTPTDLVSYNFMSILIEQGNSYNIVREMAIFGTTDKVSRSRIRTRLDKIYDTHIKNSDDDKMAEHMSVLFEGVGWV